MEAAVNDGATPEQVEQLNNPVLSQAERIARIRAHAQQLAGELRDATDAGVSHAIILPQLMLVFREVFGELPAGMAIPGLPEGMTT